MSLFSIGVNAQDTSDDETATTERWKGSNVSNLSNGTKFYLYNVGTGKFLIAGGAWGTSAMLMYQDFGALLELYKSGSTTAIASGAKNTATQTGKYLGVNYPSYTSGGSWSDTQSTRSNFDVIMEAQISSSDNGRYSRNLTFTRVENSGDVYSYYITEKVTNSSYGSKTFYIGAGKGVNTSTGTDDQTVSTDKVAYTEKQATQTGNTNYQWRFVTENQMKEVMNATTAAMYGGLSANISYLIDDPYFDRNRNDEWNTWKVKSGTTTGIRDQYLYKWYKQALNADTQGETTSSTPWDQAVGNKIEFDLTDYGKYGFAMLDGIGTISQTLSGLQEGYYKVECRGFWQGHEGKLYATSGSNNESVSLTEASGFKKVTNVTSGSVWSSSTMPGADLSELEEIGIALYNNSNNAYTTSVTIHVDANGSLTFGIQKDAATKSNAYSNSYYYDTDIVAFDNFNLYYLGKEKPFLLDQDKTDEGYIDSEFGVADNSNVTTYLHRTFTTGEWNSFVLPVNLSSAQVKQCFGDNAKIAKLHGVSTNHNQEGGHTSNNSLCIDFKTIDLSQELTNAVVAGSLYIIKPEKAGADTYSINNEDGTTTTVTGCYNIGRHDYSGQKPDPKKTLGTADNNIEFVGTYKQITSADGPQAGSYAFSKGDLYHLSEAMGIKGFRGWINILTTNANSVTFAIDANGQTTYIDGVSVRENNQTNDVYSLNGQLVRKNATSLEGLAKGVYVMNGKKYIVK